MNELDNLVLTQNEQNKNIGELAKVVSTLSDQVEKRPTKRVLYRLLAALTAVVLTLSIGLNYGTFAFSKNSLDKIESCTTPEGECTKRGAESQTAAVANIVCNQEKVVYLLDTSYVPLEYCAEFVNFEIDRIGADAPRVPVNPEVTQYGLHRQ
jgi:hypothetical protein